MTDTNALWAGTFGDDYTARNRVDWRKRIPFWRSVIESTGARSVYETGCNAGWNLSAIRRAFPDVGVTGHDINLTAVAHAVAARLDVFPHDTARIGELSFTAGALIHIAPDALKAFMERIVEHATHYVLAVEYAAEREEMIEYRGHTGALWRRDYGKLYQDMGLTLRGMWYAGEGFDHCTAWLMVKP